MRPRPSPIFVANWTSSTDMNNTKVPNIINTDKNMDEKKNDPTLFWLLFTPENFKSCELGGYACMKSYRGFSNEIAEKITF